jgi:carboxyl-terminal processing protease
MKNRQLVGILQGTVLGLVLMLALVSVAGYAAIDRGYVKLGQQGEIYVQDVATDSGDGIGTLAEGKLNAMEDVLASFYFDDVDEETLLDGIYKGYLSSFGDKYTTYYTAEEYSALKESDSGAYYGIGAVVRKNEDGSVKVVEPYDGSPAKEAGLLVDDAIIAVNGKSVLDMDLSNVVAEIKGDENTYVELELRRDGVEGTLKLSVQRRRIELQTVEYEMLKDSIGYIEVLEFDEVTANQFINAYTQLKSQGMEGLVVDIRSNPGGMLSTVVSMLDYILPDGLIVYTEDKYGKRTEYKGSDSNVIDVPLAVLVNGESASASEIFAGAVQDYGIGAIIGTTTFGKGIVQVIRPMTDGSAIKYTVSKYYTPKGQDIHGNGVKPDIEVELSDEFKELTEYDADKDDQLQTAIQYLEGEMSR